MQYVPGYVNQMNELLSISHVPALVKLDWGAAGGNIQALGVFPSRWGTET